MKTNEIRKVFFEFFKKKNHIVKPSDSLVPSNDPTLLFTSAGMVQFKSLFLAKGKLEFTRAVTCQKCFRADLDEVGYSGRHHTFFEMLGNFSFGDYFKEEAITWAWEFITEVIKIPKEALWISIYKDDDEVFDIWNKKIKVSEKKIVRLGKEDNFWGPVNKEGGPCGPCSEIYIDHGPERGCKKPSCTPGCKCSRFEEFWNLVFPSFNQDSSGKLHPLEKKGVDTGMGLERLASILQKVDNNFEIDIIKPILLKVADIAEVKYKANKETDISLKIITDHIRALVFLICDGVIPSNEGRGYVLRRILRRASMQGKKINIDKPFLYGCAGDVIELMKLTYPELETRREYISSVIQAEEQRFAETLDSGMKIIENLIDELKKKQNKKVAGKDAFKLYDTYGFPLELTKEILGEHSIEVDEKEFNLYLGKQQEQSRKGWKGSGSEAVPEIYSNLKSSLESSQFVGYDKKESNSRILAILNASNKVKELKKGESGEIILDITPFYPKSGGQIGDKGAFLADNVEVEVVDTLSPVEGLIVHKVKVTRGEIKEGMKISAKVDAFRRREVSKHHTATHLLQSALRQVLGNHVAQSGSEVRPDKLRFDFTHFQGITKRELQRVEDIVNENISSNMLISTRIVSLEKAREEKALAFFGEKYSSEVRMVDMGKASRELCGGTHLKNTSEIGLFKIISEGSVSAGVRRIEAVVGNAVYNYVKKQEEFIDKISGILNVPVSDIENKIEKLLKDLKELEKQLNNSKSKMLASNIDEVIENSKKIDGIEVVSLRIDGLDMESLRETGDSIRDRLKSGVIVIGGSKDEKAHIVVMVTDDISGKVNASLLTKELARTIDGSGGGNPTLAQAGGKNTKKLDDMFNSIPEAIKKIKNN